jgi:hypothetical protein
MEARAYMNLLDQNKIIITSVKMCLFKYALNLQKYAVLIAFISVSTHKINIIHGGAYSC